jgi:hypothetical protein
MSIGELQTLIGELQTLIGELQMPIGELQTSIGELHFPYFARQNVQKRYTFAQNCCKMKQFSPIFQLFPERQSKTGNSPECFADLRARRVRLETEGQRLCNSNQNIF